MFDILNNLENELMEELYSKSKRMAVDKDILATKLSWFDMLDDQKDPINSGKLQGTEDFRLRDISESNDSRFTDSDFDDSVDLNELDACIHSE